VSETNHNRMALKSHLQVFMCFALVCNCIVSAMLLLGGMKNASFFRAVFMLQMRHFAKTGSGRTWNS
jgi:hypothetical protein